MSELPLISVVTPVFNGEKSIARVIESVLGQTYPHVEYIIMDGASTDQTVAVAESYRAAFAERGYLYRIISEKDNGMYDAINKANALLDVELIGNVNGDDFYELDAVSRMVEFYKKEKYDVAWGDLRLIKPSGNMIKKATDKKSWTHHQGKKTEMMCPFLYKIRFIYNVISK